MPADETLMDAEERMEKAVAVFGDNLSGIRTGRATPGLVDSLRVEVYGSMQPLKQLAAIGTEVPQEKPSAEPTPVVRNETAPVVEPIVKER